MINPEYIKLTESVFNIDYALFFSNSINIIFMWFNFILAILHIKIKYYKMATLFAIFMFMNIYSFVNFS